jgi:hypothetical protein
MDSRTSIEKVAERIIAENASQAATAKSPPGGRD